MRHQQLECSELSPGERSPIHLLLWVEGEHASRECGGGAIQKAAIVQNGQQPLHITVAEPVVEDSRKPQWKAWHWPCMEAIRRASVWRNVI